MAKLVPNDDWEDHRNQRRWIRRERGDPHGRTVSTNTEAHALLVEPKTACQWQDSRLGTVNKYPGSQAAQKVYDSPRFWRSQEHTKL